MLNEGQLAASISYKITDFPVTESDLKAPTPTFVQNYFICFLQELGVNVGQFHLTDIQSAKMTRPSSLRHISPLLQLFGAVNYIAKQIFVKDFSLKDITQPDPGRTLYILNCFDGFHMHADKLAGRVQERMKQLCERRVEYKQLEALVLSLRERVQEQGKMQPVNNGIRQEIMELKKKLAHKHQEIREIEEKVPEVDSAIMKGEMKQERVSSEYHQVNDKLEKLQSRVVQSPEVDQMDLKLCNLERKKRESENTIQETQNNIQEKIREINLFKKYISDLGHGTQVMQTIVEVATQNRMLNEKLQSEEKRYLTAKNKEADAKEKLTKLNRKVEQLNEQKRMTKNAVEQELAGIEKKNQEAEKEFAELEKVAESCIDLKNKIDMLEEEIEKKVVYSNKLCDMYDKEYENNRKKMNNKIDKLCSINEDKQ